LPALYRASGGRRKIDCSRYLRFAPWYRRASKTSGLPNGVFEHSRTFLFANDQMKKFISAARIDVAKSRPSGRGGCADKRYAAQATYYEEISAFIYAIMLMQFEIHGSYENSQPTQKKVLCI